MGGGGMVRIASSLGAGFLAVQLAGFVGSAGGDRHNPLRLGVTTSPVSHSGTGSADGDLGRGSELKVGASGGCAGTRVAPGDDLQAALDKAGPGGVLCLAEGVYRIEAPLRPSRGQRLSGKRGAVLSGAKVITGFTESGGRWSAAAFLPPETGTHGDCTAPGCTDQQDVFLAGQPLRRVLSADQVVPGTFYADHAANRVTLGEDPGGRIVEQAFAPALVVGDAESVTVENLVLEMAANIAQSGALDAHGEQWTVRYNEVRYNHGIGIKCQNGQISHNFIHHNGQLGIAGQGGKDKLVEANEISFNNIAGYASGWEAGGSKWVNTRGLTVRNNYVHNNVGPGLWTDIDNEDTVYEGNEVRDNGSNGIIHEIGFHAIIRNNLVTGNGTNGTLDRTSDSDGWGSAGIQIAASRDVEVTGNRVSGNRNGIMALQQARGAAQDGRPYTVENLDVHDNEIQMSVGYTGLVEDIKDDTYFTSRKNRFHHNRYHLDAIDSRRFAWVNGGRTLDEWRRYGNDTDGEADARPHAEEQSPPRPAVGPR
jgi:hypothetical protein